MTGYGTGDFWNQLYVAPPPGDPACADVTPVLFDIHPDDAQVLSRARTAGKPAPHHIATRLDVALRYCAQCPLAVRDWCAESVRPAASGVGIIAGGKVYSRGRVVWDVERQTRLGAA